VAGAHGRGRASYVPVPGAARPQQRARKRDERPAASAELSVVDGDRRFPLDREALRALIQTSCDGLDAGVSADAVMNETLKNLYDGVPLAEVHKSAILAAPRAGRDRPRLRPPQRPPACCTRSRREVLGQEADHASMGVRYPECFARPASGWASKPPRLDERLAQFDLDRLAGAPASGNATLQFTYLGLQTLYDRYFLHHDGRRFRAAADLLHARGDGVCRSTRSTARRGAIEFYEVLSRFRLHVLDPDPVQLRHLPPAAFVVLPDHGGRHNLDSIYEAIKEKRAARQVRGPVWATTGPRCARPRLAHTRPPMAGRRGRGAVPEGRQRTPRSRSIRAASAKGAVCCYLEVWHLDIEEFLELRKNTGRRPPAETHDMNTGELDPGPVHETGRAGTPNGRCCRRATARSCTT